LYCLIIQLIEKYLKNIGQSNVGKPCLDGLYLLPQIEKLKTTIMDEQIDFIAETLKSLKQLNQKINELINMQRKAVTGYDYVNANELAELLGESKKTIYTRVHNRQIPYYKPGGKLLLFKLDEIQEWVKSGRHSSIEEIRQRI